MNFEIHALVAQAYCVFGSHRIEIDALYERLDSLSDPAPLEHLRQALPQLLELVGNWQSPDHIGLGFGLRHLGRTDWRTHWARVEVDLLDRFFDALLRAGLQRIEWRTWPGDECLDPDLTDVLTLAITAGADPHRLLEVWRAAADPEAAIHMAALRYWIAQDAGGVYFHRAFLDDHRDAAGELGRFLMQEEVTVRIERAFDTTTDQRIAAVLLAAV